VLKREGRQTEDVVSVSLASVNALTAEVGKHGAHGVSTAKDGEHLCRQRRVRAGDCQGVIAGGKPPLDGPSAATYHQGMPSLSSRRWIPSLRYIQVRNLAKRYFLFPRCQPGFFSVNSAGGAAL
jgi:hypothetical protein